LRIGRKAEKPMISRRSVLFFAALLMLPGSALVGHAQDAPAPHSDSLADASRKARAEKKDSSKSLRVFTNEDVSSLKGTISVVGNAPAAAAETASADGTTKTAKLEQKDGATGGPSAKDEGTWRKEFAEARKVLADDTKELDILQRELNLKQEQYYQDPTAAMKQQYSRDDVDKAQSDIAAKKLDVEKDKQTLSDLQDALRKSGGDAGWADEPASSGNSGPSSSDAGKAGSGTSTPSAAGSTNSAPL
jgi:hypothetical protein